MRLIDADCGLKGALNDWFKPREEAEKALEGMNDGANSVSE